jgi:cytoskeletal protein RodZ
MNSLIIIACFVVALLAIVGLVFALHEPATSTTKPQETTPNTPAPARAEAKATTQLPDLSTVQAQTPSPEQPTIPPTAPAQIESTPPTVATSEDADLSDEHPDVDELDYADLPTIRSLPSNYYDGTRAEEERTRVTYQHLQTIANELRALHSQMKNMEQRINILTDQVQYLRGNDASEDNWDVTNLPFKVPAQ